MQYDQHAITDYRGFSQVQKPIFEELLPERRRLDFGTKCVFCLWSFTLIYCTPLGFVNLGCAGHFKTEGSRTRVSNGEHHSQTGKGEQPMAGCGTEAIAPYGRSSCPMDSEEQGAIGSSTLPPRSWRLKQSRATDDQSRSTAPKETGKARICCRSKNLF